MFIVSIIRTTSNHTLCASNLLSNMLNIFMPYLILIAIYDKYNHYSHGCNLEIFSEFLICPGNFSKVRETKTLLSWCFPSNGGQ